MQAVSIPFISYLPSGFRSYSRHLGTPGVETAPWPWTPDEARRGLPRSACRLPDHRDASTARWRGTAIEPPKILRAHHRQRGRSYGGCNSVGSLRYAFGIRFECSRVSSSWSTPVESKLVRQRTYELAIASKNPFLRLVKAGRLPVRLIISKDYPPVGSLYSTECSVDCSTRTTIYSRAVTKPVH